MSILDYKAKMLNGEEVDLSQYLGKVVLVVNTASKCGFTPQYEGLQKLYDKYEERGLVILGFPCNQFKKQEPGDAGQIKEFCQLNYGVKFPMFAKIDVNGADAHPFFTALKEAAPGLLGSKAVKWNFTKFLISKDGSEVIRFAPATNPQKLEKDIERMLGGA